MTTQGISVSDFNEFTTGTEVAERFKEDVKGKIVIITGVSPHSLGAAVARSLAPHEPQLLLLVSRSQSMLDAVATTIKDVSNVPVKTVTVDLSSQKSVRRAAGEINKLVDRIDVLINNAAVVVPDRRLAEDGVELQFATNHVGPFLLTNLVMSKLRSKAKASKARVVNLTSLGHRISPIRFSDYNFDGLDLPEDERPPSGLPASFYAPGSAYSGFVAYGQCKTANILLSLYLNAHLAREGIVSYAVHPGSIHTELSRNLDEGGKEIIKNTSNHWKTLDQGAATTVVAAFDPGLNDPDGVLLSDCQFVTPAPHASDLAVAERLWHLSEQLVGESFPFPG